MSYLDKLDDTSSPFLYTLHLNVWEEGIEQKLEFVSNAFIKRSLELFVDTNNEIEIATDATPKIISRNNIKGETQ